MVPFVAMSVPVVRVFIFITSVTGYLLKCLVRGCEECETGFGRVEKFDKFRVVLDDSV